MGMKLKLKRRRRKKKKKERKKKKRERERESLRTDLPRECSSLTNKENFLIDSRPIEN